MRDGENPKYPPGDHFSFVLWFLADIGFTIGKLFPTTYSCRSLDCAKITHNCCMTLCTLGFAFAETSCLLKFQDEQGYSRAVMGKTLELTASLAYVVYDSVTQDPPGEGTTVLIVIACLGEAGLILFEAYYSVVHNRPVPRNTAFQGVEMSGAPRYYRSHEFDGELGFPQGLPAKSRDVDEDRQMGAGRGQHADYTGSKCVVSGQSNAGVVGKDGGSDENSKLP